MKKIADYLKNSEAGLDPKFQMNPCTQIKQVDPIFRLNNCNR